MGFITGFTGGVTLTLSLAYLSVVAHQRTREEQRRAVRAQALALRGLVDPVPLPLPPSRAELAAAQRAASVEAAKDRWNEEVENAVRWVQKTDWDEVRQGLETHAAVLWARAFGEAADEAADEAAGKQERLAGEAKASAGEARGGIAAAASGAFGRAQQPSGEAAPAVQGKADDAQGVIASALGKGRGKAQEMVDKVKSAVGMAEDGSKAATAGGEAPSPVEKALQQRYEKPDVKAARGAAEVLKERYTPMDQRDNTVLRGV